MSTDLYALLREDADARPRPRGDGGESFTAFTGLDAPSTPSTAPRRPISRLDRARRLYEITERALSETASSDGPDALVIAPALRRMARRELGRATRDDRADRRAGEAAFWVTPAPSPAADDAAVATSVRAFQRRHMLKADGRVGPITATALRGDFAGARRLHRLRHPNEGQTR